MLKETAKSRSQLHNTLKYSIKWSFIQCLNAHSSVSICPRTLIFGPKVVHNMVNVFPRRYAEGDLKVSEGASETPDRQLGSDTYYIEI